MYRGRDLKDPPSLYNRRLTLMWQRIQTLNNDYQKVDHYFSKAIIETELERLVDEYIERSFILQNDKKE